MIYTTKGNSNKELARRSKLIGSRAISFPRSKVHPFAETDFTSKGRARSDGKWRITAAYAVNVGCIAGDAELRRSEESTSIGWEHVRNDEWNCKPETLDEWRKQLFAPRICYLNWQHISPIPVRWRHGISGVKTPLYSMLILQVTISGDSHEVKCFDFMISLQWKRWVPWKAWLLSENLIEKVSPMAWWYCTEKIIRKRVLSERTCL